MWKRWLRWMFGRADQAEPSLFHMILEKLSDAPASQLSEGLRLECIAMLDEDHTEREKYDFLVKLSREPETECSRFVKELCRVDAHYERPS